MPLRERLQLWTTVVVVLTTAVVGFATWLWGAGTGVVVVQTAAGLVALLIAHLGMRSLAMTSLRQAEELERQVRRRTAEPGTEAPLPPPGPDLQALGAAVDDLLADRRQRETALREQVRAVTRVLDRSTSGLAIAGADGRFTYVNPTLRTMFRLRGEPLGRTPLETLSVIEVHDAVSDALEGQTVEHAFSTADADFRLTASPLDDGSALVRVDDITREREAERSRSAFVANVSHELRTPVTAVMGYTETLLADKDTLPDDVVPLLETIERNARRLRDLFEDLLKLHRIETRRHQIPLERQPLAPLLERATAAARDLAQTREQHFELSCPDELTALVNPEAFGAIVGNLASNAVRYTPVGGHITVSATRGDEGPMVQVRDDGIGIAEAHHERIFERFYRVDDARSRSVGGTGLGLAIVKHYALASRCQVRLSSASDAGTTFTVVMPP